MKTALRLAILSLVALRGGEHRAADADQPSLSVPVRVLPAPSERPDAMPNAVAMRPAIEPSGGLPLQYRPGPRGRLDNDISPEDPTVRFVVPLVERPILVEARITIDGQPFRMLRERRIGRLLEELAEPVEIESVDEPVTTDSANTEPTNSEPTTDEPDTGDAPEDSASSVPAVDNSIPGRLRRYVQSTQRLPTRDEIRWILANWADGPTLLILNENFAAARAHQSPLFKVLDRDEDGVISAAELAGAEPTLLRYDRNQDDILSFEEVTEAARRTPADGRQHVLDPAPLIPLDELANVPTLRRLAQYYATGDSTRSDGMRRFDPDGNGRLDETELLELHGSEPDVRIAVDFDIGDASGSRIEITSLRIPAEEVTTRVHAGSITLNMAGTLLEFSAVQTAANAGSDQISLGAVRDGYPLLPHVDQNEDGRLTLRELRQVAAVVSAFDRDQDGQIAAGELLPTMRVTVGHGPIAHQPLATVRSIYPPVSTTPLTPPDWFIRMDRNQDGDLTRREFLGGKEQFDALDADGDGLISVEEALARE